MSNKLNKEESEGLNSLREEQGEAKFSLHQNASASAKGVESIKKRVEFTCTTKQMWAAVAITALMVCFFTNVSSGIWHWNKGYPVASMLGLIPEGTKSGYEEHAELVELRLSSIEDIALGKKVSELRKKLGYKNETEEVLRGILKDDPGFLESAKTRNADRDGLFDFIYWNSPDKYVEMMMERNSYNCIQWVISQPKWYSCLNEQVYFRVLEFSEREHMTTQKMWANLSKARVKKQMLLGWWHDDPSYIDNSNPDREVVDINSLSNAWLTEFLDNCQRDGRTNILNYLQLNLEKNALVPAQFKDK